MVITQGEDLRESVPCIFCGTIQADVYAQAKSRYDSRLFTVLQCRQCGLVYTSPRVANKAAEIASHNPPPAEIFEDGTLDSGFAAAQMQLRRLERFMPPGRILDFGCGEGVLVEVARQRGWDALGADIDRSLIEWGNAHWGGHRLVCDDIDTLVQKHGGEFDAIVSKQVFEHLPNPLEFLTKMRSLLKPGGLILVDVPNLRCLGERLHRGSTLDPTAHMYYFTPSTIRRLFEEAGFASLQCSGAPNMLGTYYRICRRLNIPQLAPRLSAVTQRLPLPQIGLGLFVIARMRESAAGALQPRV